MNRIIITGNLTQAVELRSTASGLSVAEFGIAVNEKVKKGNDWVKETSFFDVVAFGSTAEVIGEYTEKGSPLLFEGRLKQETWEKDGQKRSKVKIIADKVEFIGKKGDNKPALPTMQSQKPKLTTVPVEDDGSDDVPF